MEPASTLLLLTATALLLLVNAVFVAAEFSLVSVRRSRIERLAATGHRRARLLLAALERPDDFLTSVQLGITSASLGLGYVFGSFVHAVLPDLSAATGGVLGEGAAVFLGIGVAVAAAATLVVCAHAVAGAQVPRMIGIRHAEAVALQTAGPVLLIATVLRPVVRLAARASRRLVRALGGVPFHPHALARTPEEIRTLVDRSNEEGMVEDDQREMIRRVLDCRDLTARQVMTPRREIAAVPVTASLGEVVDRVVGDGHSRLPVYDADLDDIIGVVLGKDLLRYLAAGGSEAFDLRAVLREPYFVPDSKRVDELLAELRSSAVHLAVVLDEFGGTEGLVTLEDLLEEIVGEIYDEHDLPEPLDFQVTGDGEIVMDGRAPISEVNERFELGVPAGDYTTIGGYVFGALGRMPAPGDAVSLNGSGQLVVEATRDRRVTRVRHRPHRTAIAAPPVR